MAIEKIKYKNKVAIKNDESLPEINKVTDGNMNEIKKVMNNNADELSLIEDQIPTGQASGNPIHIADSTNLEAKLRLNGGSKQETREGKNYLDDTLIQNITVPTKAGNILDQEIQIEAGTYYFNIFVNNTQITTQNICSVNFYDEENKVVQGTAFMNTAILITEEQATKIKKIQIYINDTFISTYANQTINGAMITTKSDTVYEQYGAMPSPGYPSKVETVGSNVNLFDKDNANILTKLYIDNANMKIATTSENTNIIIFTCKKNKDYTISRGAGTQFRIATTTDMPANNVAINNTLANHTETEISITTGENDNYIVIYIGTNDLTEVLNSLKIEEGDKATAYSPYGMGSVEIEKSNKQLFNIKDLVKGMGALNLDEEDFVTVSLDNSSGTSQKYYNVYTNPSKPIKPNTKYYLVLEVKEVSGTGNIMVHSFNQSDHKPQFLGSKNYGFTNLVAGDIKIDEITSLEDFSDSNSMLRTFLSYNAGQSGSITFRISVLEEEPTAETFEYTKHEQQTKIMYTQQEMLEGDYIEDVEHHGWNKKILTGNENWNKSTSYSSENYTMFFLNITGAKYRGQVKCNMFKYQQSFTEDGTFISSAGNSINIKVENSIIGGNTVELFKTFLQNKYNAGTPLIAYYQLSTPLDLELTEEQKEVQKINTYNNVTNIVADNSLATLDVEYKKDQETLNKSYEDRIAALEAAILS